MPRLESAEPMNSGAVGWAGLGVHGGVLGQEGQGCGMLDVTGLVFQAGLLSQEPRSLNSKGEIAGVGGAPPPAPGSCLRDEHSLGVPCLGMPCPGMPCPGMPCPGTPCPGTPCLGIGVTRP